LATTYKILGQTEPTNTNNTTLYTVPASKSAIVSNLTVTNTTASVTNFRVFVVAAGDTPGTDNALFYDGDIEANTAISFTLGLTLGAGDFLSVRSAATTALTFQAFGSELS
jgi:cellobiose phosphorylase